MLVSMRKAAALAFAVPGLEVDIRTGAELVARVHRRRDHPLGTVAPSAIGLCPGAFRTAIGNIVAGEHRAGVAFLDSPKPPDIHVELFMPFTGATGSLGMVVARLGETIVHVFATTRPPSEATAVIAEVGCHPAINVAVNASWDATTQVTLVHAESKICNAPLARPHIEAMMNAAFVRLAVDEITAAVAASLTGTSPTENRQDHP